MEGEKATTIQLSNVKGDVTSSSSSLNSSSNLEAPASKRSIWRTCIRGVDMVNHILIAALTCFTLSYSLRAINTLNLHITLCTIGYVLLMSEAIVVLAGESILTNSLTHRAKKHLHWVLQILGVIFIVAGVVVMYRVKTLHFRSIHAILGITSVCVMIFLAIFGYPVYIAAKLRKVIRPVVIKFGHNFLGISCFAIGMASQCYGYKKFRAINILPDVDVRMICIVITAIITILSARKALPSLFRQIVTLFR